MIFGIDGTLGILLAMSDLMVGVLLIGLGITAAAAILFRLAQSYDSFSATRLQAWAQQKAEEFQWEVMDEPPDLLGSMRERCRAMSDTTVIRGLVFILSKSAEVAVYVPRQSFSGSRNTNGRAIAAVMLPAYFDIPDFLIEKRQFLPRGFTGYRCRRPVPTIYATTGEWEVLSDSDDDAERVLVQLGTGVLQQVLASEMIYEVAGAGRKLVIIGPYAKKPTILSSMFVLAHDSLQVAARVEAPFPGN